MDIDMLKKICATNELDFSLIENQIKVELLWNSLIFQLYKDRISINLDEIEVEKSRSYVNSHGLHMISSK